MRLTTQSVAHRRSTTTITCCSSNQKQHQQQHRSQPPPPPPPPQKQQQAISRSTLLKSALASAFLSTSPASASATVTSLPSETAITATQTTLSKVILSTLSDCQLAVSIYPTFAYNAAGGGGTGTVSPYTNNPDLLAIEFDPATLVIPPITYQTSSVLGIPIPPPLKIAITPRTLKGTINPTTGEAHLDFLASFEFTAGPLYKAAPLIVETTLTSEESVGVLRQGAGQRLQADGRATLVGVARVPRTDDAFLNTFLMLPTDALAVLSAELKFS